MLHYIYVEYRYRPSQIVGKSPMELACLRQAHADCVPDPGLSESTLKLIEMVKQSNVSGLRALLANARATGTLTEFVLNTIVPLLKGLNTDWPRMEIEVYREHLCTSVIERCLHAEILSCKPKRGYPTILFAAVAGERHMLGLLMAEAALADQGANTISMGSHAPFNDVKLGVAACDADVIALSFSIAFAARRVRPALLRLRRLLPDHVEIWAGGAASAVVMRPPKGVRIFSEIQEPFGALRELSGRKRG